MRNHIITLIAVTTLAAATAQAQQPAASAQQQPLTLVEVQPFGSAAVSATGRVQPVICARIGSRVSGTIAQFGKDKDGNMLDEGMTVKAGQELFSLDQTTFKNSVAVAEAACKAAQAAYDNLVAKTRPERLEQFRQVIAELESRLAEKRGDETRFRRLVEEEKTLPVKRLEEVQTEVAVLVAQLKAAKARLEEAENGPTKTEIAVALAQGNQALAALKSAQDDQRDSVVVAPFDGLITKRYKSPGDYATGAPHTDVLELTSTDKLEVELRLPEGYLGSITAGKTAVRLRCPLLKKEIESTVTRVVPAVEKASGTFAVRVSVPAGNCLPPGSFVTAEVQADGSSLGVLVPLRSVMQVKGQSCVFVAKDGKAVRCNVEVGERLTEAAVIKSGLSAGQKVLVGPVETVEDGQALPEAVVGQKK